MRRTTLPAPAQPSDDPRWDPRHTSESEYLYFQRQEDALAFAVSQGYQQDQGRPGEVFPYDPAGPLRRLNPRLSQMEALARWAASEDDDRGSRPSTDPDAQDGELVDGTITDRWSEGPLPYECGLTELG